MSFQNASKIIIIYIQACNITAESPEIFGKVKTSVSFNNKVYIFLLELYATTAEKEWQFLGVA